jgi:hypothetical protein
LWRLVLLRGVIWLTLGLLWSFRWDWELNEANTIGEKRTLNKDLVS